MTTASCKGDRTKFHMYSKKQWRKLFAMERRGELKKGEALHHAKMSKREGRSYASLPEAIDRKKRKKAFERIKKALTGR